MLLKTAQGLDVQLSPPLLNMLFLRANKETDGKTADQVKAMISLRSGDRVAIGATAEPKIPVATAWGPTGFSGDQVQDIWLQRAPARSHRIILADGGRLSGIVTANQLQFESLRWGKIDVAPHAMRRFEQVPRAVPDEHGLPAQEIDEDPDLWKIERPYCLLAGNNAFRGSLQLKALNVVSPAGSREVPLEQLAVLQRHEDDEGGSTQPLFLVVLRDGDQFAGRLEQAILPFRVGQAVWRVPNGHLVALHVREPPKIETEDPEDDGEDTSSDKPGLEVLEPLRRLIPGDPFGGPPAPQSQPGGQRDPFGGGSQARDPFAP
jgi:hypothetical protein